MDISSIHSLLDSMESNKDILLSDLESAISGEKNNLYYYSVY